MLKCHKEVEVTEPGVCRVVAVIMSYLTECHVLYVTHSHQQNTVGLIKIATI